MSDIMWCRLALVVALVDQAPQKMLGRTALMKLLFLLGAVRDVSLGYRFRMYTYGPFDAEVLSDVDYAARLSGVTVDMDRYPNGYGYTIRPGTTGEAIMSRAGDFLMSHKEDISWAVTNFSDLSALDLELLSTIVYVARRHRVTSLREITEAVHEIIPRFSLAEIQQGTIRLQASGVEVATD